jgi:hypothetical protein
VEGSGVYLICEKCDDGGSRFPPIKVQDSFKFSKNICDCQRGENISLSHCEMNH